MPLVTAAFLDVLQEGKSSEAASAHPNWAAQGLGSAEDGDQTVSVGMGREVLPPHTCSWRIRQGGENYSPTMLLPFALSPAELSPHAALLGKAEESLAPDP